MSKRGWFLAGYLTGALVMFVFHEALERWL